MPKQPDIAPKFVRERAIRLTFAYDGEEGRLLSRQLVEILYLTPAMIICSKEAFAGTDASQSNGALQFTKVSTENLFEAFGCKDGDDFALHPDYSFVPELSKRPRKCFAHGADLGGQHAFSAIELDLRRRFRDRARATLEQPIREARFHVFEREIVKQADDDAKVLAHRAEHPECELGTIAEQRQDIRLRHEENCARLDCPRIRRISTWARERSFCKGLAGAENGDDLFLARGAYAMHVHRPALHDIKAFRRRALTKKILSLGELLWNYERRDQLEILVRQPGEKLAATQRVREDDFSEVRKSAGHAINHELANWAKAIPQLSFRPFTPEICDPAPVGLRFHARIKVFAPQLLDQRRWQEWCNNRQALAGLQLIDAVADCGEGFDALSEQLTDIKAFERWWRHGRFVRNGPTRMELEL